MANILNNFSPYHNRVQEGMTDGRFMNAAYTVIAAGPPRLSNMGLNRQVGEQIATGGSGSEMVAYPIGIIQNFSLGHNMTISRFFEIGSHRSYFIPGRAMGQFSMSRVMYHGPSLLRVLYAYYTDGAQQDPDIPALYQNQGSLLDSTRNIHDVKMPPGYENIYLNLASDLFTQPIGLMLIMKDSNEKTMGAFYLESCYIPNHNLGTDAMGTIIQEQVSIQFERVVPIKTNVIGLITSDDQINFGQAAEVPAG